MCPACLSTVALIAAGAGSTGGLVLVVRKFRGTPSAHATDTGAPAIAGNEERPR